MATSSVWRSIELYTAHMGEKARTGEEMRGTRRNIYFKSWRYSHSKVVPALFLLISSFLTCSLSLSVLLLSLSLGLSLALNTSPFCNLLSTLCLVEHLHNDACLTHQKGEEAVILSGVYNNTRLCVLIPELLR